MAIKIKLTERQQKLAAGELNDEPIDNLEEMRNAGFEFVETDDADSGGDEGGSASGDDDDEPSGEYIDDGVSDGDDGGNPEGGDAGGASSDWIDDSVRDYAASYGLSDVDLEQFGSLADLHRFGSVMDRRYAGSNQGGTSQTGEGDGGESRGTEREQQSKEHAGQGESGQSGQKSGLLDRLKVLDRKAYEEAKYGDRELELVDQLNGAIEAIREIAPDIAFVQEMRQSRQKETVESAMREFDKALDELDPVVFGKAYDGDKPAGKMSDAFLANRRAVWDTMERLSKGITADAERRGVQAQIPSTAALARRAAAIVAGEFSQSGSQSNKQGSVSREQVESQSRRRRPTGSGGTKSSGTGSTRSSKQPVSEADEVKAIANSPDIAKFFRNAQQQNGAT